MSLKKLIIALAGLALLTSSCTVVHNDSDEMSYTIPRSAALVTTSVYIGKHPESIDALAQVADKLATLAADPVIPIEDIFSQVSSIVNESTIKNKSACLAVLRSLIFEYNISAVTIEDYSYVLKELAEGIIEAIDLHIFQNPT